jgi:hypothetical protein
MRSERRSDIIETLSSILIWPVSFTPHRRLGDLELDILSIWARQPGVDLARSQWLSTGLIRIERATGQDIWENGKFAQHEIGEQALDCARYELEIQIIGFSKNPGHKIEIGRMSGADQ